jgi:hypothetical protein
MIDQIRRSQDRRRVARFGTSGSSEVRLPMLNSSLLSGSFILIALLIALYRLPILDKHLYVGAGEYAFGRVPPSTMVSAEFQIRNLHPWEVTIVGIRGGCGCTRNFPGKEVPFTLRPLEAARIKVALDTVGKSGEVREAIHVLTSDNPHHGTVFYLYGEIRR